MNAINREIHEKELKILYKEESYAIQGAIFEVYREMGCGFLEAVYQECLEREFFQATDPFLFAKWLNVKYKGETLQQIFRPDFVCYDKVIVELKAIKDVDDDHRAQVFNYLKATCFRLGLLVNFGHYPRATVERIALQNSVLFLFIFFVFFVVQISYVLFYFLI
jgi:GxxExxY protein